MHAYFFDKAGNIRAQCLEILAWGITRRLSGISTAYIVLDARKTPKIALNERVELWGVEAQTEKKYFSGIVTGFVADTETVRVEFSDAGHPLHADLFNMKMTMTKKILEESHIFCKNPDEIPPAEEVAPWSSVMDYLTSVSAKGWEYRSEGAKILLAKNVGEDKTQGVIFYTDSETKDTNIEKIESRASLSEIFSVAYVEDVNTNYVDRYQNAEAIEAYGYRAKWVRVSESGWNEEAFFRAHARQKNEITIIPLVHDFLAVDVGDRVAVKIHTKNPFLAGQSVMKVAEKSLEYRDLPRVSLVLSPTGEASPTVMGKIRSLENRITNLETR